jgi:RNA polymerase sigma factor (sigma-70 family)
MALAHLEYRVEPEPGPEVELGPKPESEDGGKLFVTLGSDSRARVYTFTVPRGYNLRGDAPGLCSFVRDASKPYFHDPRFDNGFTPWEIHEDYDEMAAFASLHYQRKIVRDAAEKITDGIRTERTKLMLAAFVSAKEIEGAITEKHIGLIRPMGKRAMGWNYLDNLDVGFEALSRAVGAFDYRRGYRFSTYACTAILRGFSNLGKQIGTRRRRLAEVSLENAADRTIHWRRERREEEFGSQAEFVAEMIRMNSAELSDAEMEVIKQRMGANGNVDDKNTLRAIGKRIRLSCERVRQIERTALKKLRETMEQGYFGNPDD